MSEWFYSKTFHHYQKVNNKVYAYVSSMIGGAWKAQMYYRGSTGLCELEVRTSTTGEEGFLKMIQLADSWLESYSDGDSSRIQQDKYHVFNPQGVWADHSKKEYWI